MEMPRKSLVTHLCVPARARCQSGIEPTPLTSQGDRGSPRKWLGASRRQHPLSEEWWWRLSLFPISCARPRCGHHPSTRLTERGRLSCLTQPGKLLCECLQAKAGATKTPGRWLASWTTTSAYPNCAGQTQPTLRQLKREILFCTKEEGKRREIKKRGGGEEPSEMRSNEFFIVFHGQLLLLC